MALERLKSFLQNLYLGKHKGQELDDETQQTAVLTGHLVLVTLFVCVFYTFLEINIGDLFYLPFYAMIILFSIGALLLLRLQRYTLAKSVFLFPVITIVALFTSIEKHETGLYLYFIAGCLCAFTLFGYAQRGYAIFTVLYILLLFSLSYLLDHQLFEPVNVSEEYVRSSFIFNFLISTLASVAMLYYLMHVNVGSKRHLQATADELKESRNRFELAILGSSGGIWDWNAKTQELFLSPRIASMLGYKKNELRLVESDWILKAIHPDDFDRFEKTFEGHVKKKKPFEIECRFRTKSGEYLWMYDTGHAEWDSNGKVLRMVGTVVDITKRKKAEHALKEQKEMLEKTNNELDRFVYSTSHDLRAPLSSILGLINIAQVSCDPAELRSLLDMMKGRVDALNTFIDEIIDYSRNSRTGIDKTTVSLFELVGEVIESLQYYENYQKLVFHNNVPKNLTLCTDRGRLKIILNNIFVNAIKYHDPHQEEAFVSLDAEMHKHWVMIRVEDNGIGIDEDIQSQIFDMFFRASEQSVGSGLGLYITKEMTEKLGGQISVTSRKGHGSTFIIKIPVGNSRTP